LGKRRNGSSGQPSPDIQPGPPAPPQPAPPRTRTAFLIAVCAALVIAIFAAFGGLLSSPFVNYDDGTYVIENSFVQKGLSGESVAWAFRSTDATNWHPLTWLSHMLDVQLFGLNAGRHHLTSLLLHACNAVLLFLLLFRMTGALWRSAFVAALFALHPLHVESVAWIAERKDVLSTLFWLLTLGAWLQYLKSKKAAPYGMALILYALGLMAKPMLVTLPFTLLLLDYWPLQRLTLPLRWRSEELGKLLWEKAPLFAMSAASCVITVIAQRGGGAVQTMEEYPFAERLANALRACAAYLGKTFWPSSLAVFYPYPHAGLFAWPVAGSALVLAGVTVLALRLAKRAPCLPVGWFWYLGMLVPVIGLVQVGGQGMADRYTYMPLIGVFIAIAWGLAWLARKIPRGRIAASCIAVVTLGVLLPITRAQTGVWRGSEALFDHALSVTSDNFFAQTMVGLFRFNQGRTDEAIAHYREALRINPHFAEAHINLGDALAGRGRLAEAGEQCNLALPWVNPANFGALNNLGMLLIKLNRIPEAIRCIERAIEIKPDFAEAHSNLGSALALQNHMPEAILQFMEALRIKPDSARTLDNLGVALGKSDRTSEAIERFRQAVRADPDFASAHYHLGVMLAGDHRTAEAQEQFQQALRLKPDLARVYEKISLSADQEIPTPEKVDHTLRAPGKTPEDARTLDNLGLKLLKLNRLPEAVECFRQAVRINPDSADARNNLGNALAGAGRLEEAVEHYRQALRIQPASVKTITNMGMALARMNRLSEAIQCFRDAIRINPDYADAQNNLGVALDETGRTAEAIEHYQQALRIQPNSAKTLDNLGLSLETANRFSEALERFQQAVEADPDSADAQCHLGMALARAHRLEEAREHLQRALQISPDFAEARAGLRDVQKALGLAP